MTGLSLYRSSRLERFGRGLDRGQLHVPDMLVPDRPIQTVLSDLGHYF